MTKQRKRTREEQQEESDEQTLYQVVEDIEKRKHTKDPFQSRYVHLTCTPFEYNESKDLKETIYQASLSVKTRCELISQMHKSLLKQLSTVGSNKQKSTSNSKKKETVEKQEGTIQLIDDIEEEWSRLQLIKSGVRTNLFNESDMPSRSELKDQIREKKKKVDPQFLDLFGRTEHFLLSATLNEKTYCLQLDPAAESVEECEEFNNEDSIRKLISCLPHLSNEEVKNYVRMEDFDYVSDNELMEEDFVEDEKVTMLESCQDQHQTDELGGDQLPEVNKTNEIEESRHRIDIDKVEAIIQPEKRKKEPDLSKKSTCSFQLLVDMDEPTQIKQVKKRSCLKLKSLEENLLSNSPPKLQFANQKNQAESHHILSFIQRIKTFQFNKLEDLNKSLIDGRDLGLCSGSVSQSNTEFKTKTIYETFDGSDGEDDMVGSATFADFSELAMKSKRKVDVKRQGKRLIDELIQNTQKRQGNRKISITRISTFIMREINEKKKIRLSDVALSLEKQMSTDEITPQRVFMALIHLVHHQNNNSSMRLENEMEDIVVINNVEE